MQRAHHRAPPTDEKTGLMMSEKREPVFVTSAKMGFMELPNRQVCYRALQSRNARFDGLLFVGVTSAGIYCRPICPARTPKFENCCFFGSAAAAQEAGFRPCLRCRPESAPDMFSWRGTSNTVSRALALITDGALDGDSARVRTLAERLGSGERQLRRLYLQHLGASPISVAQTRRVLFAKQLAPLTGKNPVPEIKAKQFRFAPNKFESAGLTPLTSELVRPARARECPVQMEARVQNLHRISGARLEQLGGGIAAEVEIVRVHVASDFVLGDRYIDPAKWSPLIYNFRHYFRLAEHELGKTFRAER
jgi:methylphosphotriester-DNA--protein-cysteine methyltransferase